MRRRTTANNLRRVRDLPLASLLHLTQSHYNQQGMAATFEEPEYFCKRARLISVPGFISQAARYAVLVVCTFLLFQFVSLYLSWQKQAVLGALSMLIALILNRKKESKIVTLSLALLSVAATLRYAWWRVHLVVSFFNDESNTRVSLDSFLMMVLLLAEAYTIGIMLLGYMQTSMRLGRKPIPMPEDEGLWPDVDVLIPTYNESLALVRYTALAAINIDYPPDKLHVYILDDGTREEFRSFAKEAGVGYLTREKHLHAKAGNINHALATTTSPLVAIFDCDHVPTRSFLQCTVGWFLVEQKLAMLQTPHYFYSPDPFERNLLQYKNVPNEGELFYGIIQDGNDLWDATFFCGSCAVLRRTALDEVGGIATETVTEDAHTSLRMQKRGWSTAYINVAQAAGLATETLAAHVGQRVRWARGMIQILRTDNPMLASKMKWSQRLCYFNAMMHFLYAVPRLIFLLSPLAYMVFGRTIIPGYWVAILAYALPHLGISSLANSRIQGRHRHSFWNEIYETVLSPYILLPTLLALVNPKLGSFNVTDKGKTLSETKFDHKIAAPTTWLLLFNLLGVLVTPYRLLVLDPQHPGVILSNLCWILFNMTILGVAVAVAHEQQQRRSSVRIPVEIPLNVQTYDGRFVSGRTCDMSVGGASVVFHGDAWTPDTGERILLSFPQQTGDDQIRATVTSTLDGVRVRFESLTIAEEETLTRALYSRADSWIGGRSNMEPDRPLVSLFRVMKLSFTGFKQVSLGLLPRRGAKQLPRVVRPATLLLALYFSLSTLAQSLTSPARSSSLASDANFNSEDTHGSMQTGISLKDAGTASEVEFRGPHSFYSVHLILPYTQAPRSARLVLNYRFSTALHSQSGTIRLRLNKTDIAELSATGHQQEPGANVVESIFVPADLLVRDNELTFEFNGTTQERNSQNGPVPVLASIGVTSTLQVVSDPIPFRNDLSTLPLPFFDSALQTTTTIPFVFLSEPTPKTLQAAGVVASWFGILASSKPVRFSVSIGSVPRGNVVIFVNSSAALATPGPKLHGAALAVRSNPSDPLTSALIVSGDNEDQLLDVARSLSTLKGRSQGEEAGAAASGGDTLYLDGGFVMPAPRKIDDAPRWLPSDRLVSLSRYSPQPTMRSDGSQPLPVYFRVPPDLFYGEAENLRLHVAYRYNAEPLNLGSALRVFINGVLINEAPLQVDRGFHDRQREALLPVASMRPFANTLRFDFDFIPSPHGERRSTASELEGTILRNSSLDLRGFDHYAAMPNLELFANAGFPFTRQADLAATTVILPTSPSSHVISLFLQLMSHFGTQTGVPALRVEVAGSVDMNRADRDYLVLGTIENQPVFTSLEGALPISFDATGLHVKQESTYWIRWRQSLRRMLDLEETGELPMEDGSRIAAMLQGIESPFGAGRSLVIIALRDDAAEEGFTAEFLLRSQSSDIAHSASILRDGHFHSYAVSPTTYHIGSISRYAVMRIWLTEHLGALLFCMTLASLVLAYGVNASLLHRAEQRLQAATNPDGAHYSSLVESRPNPAEPSR